MSGKRARIWKGVGLAAVAGAILLLIATSLEENVVYFLTPSELAAEGAAAHDRPLRLGGQVEPGTLDWNPETLDLRFVLTDGEQSIPVRSTGAPPAMFREGMGVVVEGRYHRSGTFESDNLMVKHSNEYSPPEDHEGVVPAAYETLEVEGDATAEAYDGG